MMELSMSMFASSADYWKARAELAESTIAEVAAELKCERDNEAMLQAVHNLNWALGTPGYEQMATAEEQAEHEAGCARSDAVLERMAENKRLHDATMKDAQRYRWLRSEHERFDPICHLSWKRNGDRKSSEWVNTSDLDRSIDLALAAAAMAKEPR